MRLVVTYNATKAYNKIKAAKEALDGRNIMRAFGVRVSRWMVENFRSGGKPSGGWRPLARSTVYKKGTAKPLVDTGVLERAVSSRNVEVDDHSVRVVVNVPYASFHETGTRPHKIYPRDRQWLFFAHPEGTWSWKARGGRRYHIRTKEVDHPGISSRPILPREAIAHRLFDEVAQTIIEKFNAAGAKT